MNTKRKRAIFLAGVSAAVYLFMKYLLPLVFPFFAAYGAARMIWPFVSFANKKVRLPESIGAGIGLTAIIALAAALLWWMFGLAGRQILDLTRSVPLYLEQAEAWIQWTGRQAGMKLGLNQEAVAQWIHERIVQCSLLLQESFLPGIAGCIFPAVQTIGNFFASAAVAGISALFFIKERGKIHEWKERTVFRREIRLITGRLGDLGRAFFKSQGIIFILVTAICTLGLFFMGNPYFLLLGFFIGILDVLPVFGTGTVLIPWGMILVLMGRWSGAAWLFCMYLATYLLREFLEAHMMGRQLGISSLEMMIAMYAGLKLFGLGGLFLGPIGWILIKEIDKSLYLG